MTYSYLPYIITEIYCVIFAVTVWMRLNSNMGSEHEVYELRNMIYSYLVMLISDIFCALIEDSIIILPRLLSASINATTILAISCGCYFWFRFIEDRLQYPFILNKTADRLMIVPLLIICTLNLTSIFTGWMFYIDADGFYENTKMFYITTAVNYIYLLIPTVYSAYRASKAKSRQDRGEYCTYALYMAAPLMAGVFEGVFIKVPLLALNIFMVILILFLMIQNRQVYNDALTGLNNRRRLNGYLDECISKTSDEHAVLLFIMDINRFKSINDIYGHLEGDRALKMFADVLKNIASHYYAFAARYGGDEFCMVMDAKGHAPEEVENEVRRRLQDIQENKMPYKFTVSIGYARCSSQDKSADIVIEEADRMLYDNKKEWHCRYDNL